MMGFWYCSDPFFFGSKAKCLSASPPSRGQKRRTKRKRKAEQHSDLGPKNGVYVAISWTFTQLFLAFGIFWILGETHFLKRTFWLDHPGDYQHVNPQSLDLMIPMLNDIAGSVARGTWGWFEAMKHCPGADQGFTHGLRWRHTSWNSQFWGVEKKDQNKIHQGDICILEIFRRKDHSKTLRLRRSSETILLPSDENQHIALNMAHRTRWFTQL